VWFSAEIVSGTFPTRSFIKKDGITRGVPVVVNCKSVLQSGVNWETCRSGYDAVIFQYSFGVNNNSISPQMSSEYGRSRGDFVEVCNRMVYDSVLVLAQDILAVIYKCPEFG